MNGTKKFALNEFLDLTHHSFQGNAGTAILFDVMPSSSIIYAERSHSSVTCAELHVISVVSDKISFYFEFLGKYFHDIFKR